MKFLNKLKHQIASTFVLSTLVTLSVSSFSYAQGANEAKTKQPNFVWLVSEDNYKGFLKLYNPNGASMPNVEKLAEQGLVFNNAFSNGPVCSTARSTLALGAYGPKLGLTYHRAQEHVSLPNNIKAISQLLREAGYYTANNAKEDYNFKKPKAGVWDVSNQQASWTNRKPGQPFFYMQSWETTHEGQLHFAASDVKNKPTQHSPSQVGLYPIYPDTPLFRYTFARYLDLHSTLDKQLASVINQLEVAGELENTFIFYFGDHGGVVPASKGYPFERGVSVPLVVRIPKNYKHLLHKDMQNLNTRIDGFVSFIDFAPTLLKLAGLPAQPSHDGQAFLGNDISLDALQARDFSFSYADRFDEKYDMVRAIRVGKYKYFRHYEPFNPDALFNEYRYRQAAYQEWKQMYQEDKLSKVQASFFNQKTPEALYDVEQDPHETRNLALDPNYRSVLLKLRSQLKTHLTQMPDLAFYPEHFQIKNAFKEPVEFAKKHQSDIEQLIKIADLPLQDYQMARAELIQALSSNNTWQRYWGLIAATAFAKQAVDLVPMIEQMLNTESSLLNQARAIQFLAMLDQIDPVEPIQTIVAKTSDPIEALEILNIAAQLHDVKSVAFNIQARPDWFKTEAGEDNLKIIKRRRGMFETRIRYLAAK